MKTSLLLSIGLAVLLLSCSAPNPERTEEATESVEEASAPAEEALEPDEPIDELPHEVQSVEPERSPERSQPPEPPSEPSSNRPDRDVPAMSGGAESPTEVVEEAYYESDEAASPNIEYIEASPVIESPQSLERTRTPEQVAEDYTMEVLADSTLDRDDLLVVSWDIFIPAADHVTEDRPDEVEASRSIDAAIGNYITIDVSAPNFEIQNGEGDMGECLKLTQHGLNGHFKLKPLAAGKLVVSVTAKVYEVPTCSGASVPISTETLEIEVRVNHWTSIRNSADKVISSFIDETTNFVIAIIGIVFAFLLFRFRKKLFGKNDPLGSSPDSE